MGKKRFLFGFFKQKQTIEDIWLRIRKRNFSGNEGLAIKNSLYQILTNTTSKIGSFIFTIIIARLLHPEMFGLYSLAFGTILFVSNFSDLSTGQSFIKLISSAKNKNLAESYFSYFIRVRIFLIVIVSLIFLLASYFIANNYYNKPIFYALLSGPLYILVINLLGIIDTFFYANNNFKIFFYKEIFTQASRIIIVPITILLVLKFSTEMTILFIMFSLVISNIIVLFFMYFKFRKNINLYEIKKLPDNLKKKTRKFLYSMAFMTFSSLFYLYLDIIMLGRYVDPEFLGFYRAALGLLNSATPLIAFSNVLFPIFSRLKGSRLKKALTKSKNFTIYLSIFSTIFTIVFASIIVNITLGQSYQNSTLILRISSILLIIMPLISLYETYFISINKASLLAKLLVFTTIINILLNYFLISILIKTSQLSAVIGVCIATIFSRLIYLSFLLYFRKK